MLAAAVGFKIGILSSIALSMSENMISDTGASLNDFVGYVIAFSLGNTSSEGLNCLIKQASYIFGNFLMLERGIQRSRANDAECGRANIAPVESYLAGRTETPRADRSRSKSELLAVTMVAPWRLAVSAINASF
jgi:hypothetical protein